MLCLVVCHLVDSLANDSSAFRQYDAINKFNEAMILSKECNDRLKSAEENVNKILKENGSLENFKVEEEDE